MCILNKLTVLAINDKEELMLNYDIVQVSALKNYVDKK